MTITNSEAEPQQNKIFAQLSEDELAVLDTADTLDPIKRASSRKHVQGTAATIVSNTLQHLSYLG